MLITIIGAGWYGCHLACELSEMGHRVLLLEQASEIFAGTSRNLGIRLHRVVDHEFSIYANGITDSEGFPSKVSDKTFQQVCMEYAGCRRIDPAAFGFCEVSSAYELDEPSIATGNARKWFEEKLERAGVHLVLGATVEQIKLLFLPSPCLPSYVAISLKLHGVSGSRGESITSTSILSHVAINCTGFQAFVPPQVFNPASPAFFEFTYQVCLALKYHDGNPSSNKPISFICMDGWFPCLMPVISDTTSPAAYNHDYILTHGAYTILGSFASPDQARHALSSITDDFVERRIRPPAEREMQRFWPSFSQRFTYQGWYGTVLAKPKCPTEFRSAFTFEQDRVVHIFPGKVSNVVDVCDEVAVLLQTRGTSSELVIEDGHGFRCVSNGVFITGRAELQKKANLADRSTCNLTILRESEGGVSDRAITLLEHSDPVAVFSANEN
ncbi:hypothetical protein ABW20_dc0107044 [Dactylellina cionopaga]|nr:hypothetical protein ABW20_dc0107044 [Dactylellina cionopaga]